ncbi:MAG: alpha/beta fold hydrolase [SAR202 cluster bacterium]|nr:alpha/beta fold hydrolase [SAR202 cluster bacterium]
MSLRADLTDRYVKLPNGFNIRYLERGEGRPVVLVHGLGITMAADQWINNYDALAKHLHVYSLDMPGWGLSDLPASGYSFERWAETLAQFTRALGLGQVDVIGQSLGGWSAMFFAHQHPELVRRLVLVVNAGLNPPPSGLTGAFQLPDRARMRAIHETLWRGDVRVTEEMLDELERRVRRPGRDAAFIAIRDYVGDLGVRERYSPRHLLPTMHMPVLHVWGDNADPLLVQYGIEQYDLTPHPRLAVIYDGGENPQGHAPRQFEDAATRFLTSPDIAPIKRVR